MDDLISRQDAIDACRTIKRASVIEDGCVLVRKTAVTHVLATMPSAQPIPDTTHMHVCKSKGGMTFWYECEKCGTPCDESDNYCRGCGRRFTKDV